MPRSELTLTIKRVEGMITYVRENLDEGEYDLFLDLILPEPEPVKVAKKRVGNTSLRCKAELLDGSMCHMTKAHSIHSTGNKEPNAHKFLPKKLNKGGSKSARASGMAAAISNSLNQQRQVVSDNPELTGPTCAKDGCSWKEEDLIHDPLGGYAGYHPFVSAALPVAHEAGAGG